VLLALLTAGLAAAVALTTPWHPLGVDVSIPPPDPAADFTDVQLAREDAFHALIRPWSLASRVLGIVIPLLLGLTPLGARMIETLARPLGRGWWWQVLSGAVTLTLAGRVATAPFDARVEAAAHQYGLSTSSWGQWAADQARSWALAAGVLLVAATVVYGLARVRPARWWVWLSGLAAAGVLAGSFAYPLVVEPVFNTFRPLPAGPLRAELMGLAARDGVPVREVLVADASRRTTSLNAYVSGLGASRRIVVYDTLLTQASPAQVRLIVAHELGHAARHDVLVGSLLGAGTAAALVPVLALTLRSRRLTRRAGLGRRGRLDPAGDPRSLALVLAVVTAVSVPLTPVASLLSRQVEARADVHALELTGEVGSFVAMQQALAVTNLSDLDPPRWWYLWTATHPTAPERIALARAWAAEQAHDTD
jgi:STE24 endopeptidase